MGSETCIQVQLCTGPVFSPLLLSNSDYVRLLSGVYVCLFSVLGDLCIVKLRHKYSKSIYVRGKGNIYWSLLFSSVQCRYIYSECVLMGYIMAKQVFLARLIKIKRKSLERADYPGLFSGLQDHATLGPRRINTGACNYIASMTCNPPS